MKTFNIGTKCRYKLYVYKGDGSLIRESAWSPNMVLDLGIAGLLGSPTYSTYNIRPVCGTGTAPVTPEDVNLDTFLAGGSNPAFSFNTTRSTSPSPYVKHSWRWRYSQGAVVGNVSEVGIAFSSGTPTISSSLFSRAIVVDTGGDPTTITVLSDEYLEIQYDLYLNAISSSGSFSQDIDGVSVATTYSIKPSAFLASGSLGWNNCVQTGVAPLIPNASSGTDFVTFSDGATGTIDAGITGNKYRISTATAGSVAVGNGYRDVTYMAGPGDANANLTAMQFNSGLFSFQMEVSPAVPKTSEHTYELTIRYQISRTV